MKSVTLFVYVPLECEGVGENSWEWIWIGFFKAIAYIYVSPVMEKWQITHISLSLYVLIGEFDRLNDTEEEKKNYHLFIAQKHAIQFD